MVPALAQAGPWCLVRDENEGCGFAELEACYAVAAAGGGYCRANYRDAGVVGEQAWCVINATTRRCTYYFQQQCVSAANKLKGTCVANTDLKIAQAKFRKRVGYDINAANNCEGDIACEARLAARD